VQLIRLNLSHNIGLDDTCAQSLADLLSTSSCLQALDISFCQFTKKTTMTLWKQQNIFGFKKKQHQEQSYEGLVELSIGGNKLSTLDTARELIEALFPSSSQQLALSTQKLSPLEKLSLSNFGFKIDSSPECPLHKLFLSAPYVHLTHLTLANNSIENINLLAQFITDCKSLVEVNLSKCSLDQHKIRQLFSQLQFSTSLHTVRLKGNCFGDEGADYIAQILQQQKVSSLSKPQTNGIKELDVSECELTMQGLLVLLQADTNLTMLKLRGNDLSNRTNLQAFINGFLKLNKQLTYVDLSDMDLTTKDKKLLFQCWQQLHPHKHSDKNITGDLAIFFCE
jgi:Ran GTPase-activating protein (RanGAP) involved in mRNA processing and transport